MPMGDEIEEISLPPLSQEEIDSFKLKPFDHQIEAINFGLKHPKWLLLDSMGLGKTSEMIWLAETLHKRGLIDHCLVICGVDSLRQNWKSEIQKFSDLPVLVLGERINRNGRIVYDTIPKRVEQLKNDIEEFFVVVNITTIRDDKIIEALRKSKNKFGMICFDEAHRATKGSQQGSNLLKLDSDFKVAATGTLLVNSPISAYLALAWTGNDQATLTNFKAQYCDFGGFNNSQVVGYRNLEYLKDEIDHCSLRRTFEQVRGNMPKKTIDYEIVEPDERQRKFYEAIKAGVKEEANKIELKASNMLALTTRLRQATTAPSVLTTEDIGSTKIDRAVELAEELLESGEKVIIMSTMKEPVYELATKLKRFRPLLGTGDQDEGLAQYNIDTFRNSGDFNLLIGTTAKIGTGFSMPECHYLIFVDQPWTWSTFSQCTDRIYRITSDQAVYIKVLLTQDTIDERVRQIVETKKDLADYLVDGIDNGLASEMRSILNDL